MIKQEIINILGDAREIHSKWLEYGHILVDSINVDNVEEPINCFDCDFSKRLKTDGAAFSELSWYNELQKVHEDLHKAYSDLYYESHRMYNPKTLEELMELFVTLESQAKIFAVKLDEIETEFEAMSDQDYKNILDNSNQIESEKVDTTTTESEKISDEESIAPLEMDIVDIENHEEDEFQLDDIDSEVLEKTEQTVFEDDEALEITFEQNEDANAVENKPLVQSVNKFSSVNIEQHIALKKQDIEQLKEEKELSQLELSHLEDREKLTQKRVDQIELYFDLKKQEIESENVENDQLLKYKTKERHQTNDQLADIEAKKVELNKVIEDLTSQNEKDELELKEDQKLLNIKKQFHGLKQHKTVELEDLEAHLQAKEDDVKRIQEQLRSLEQEVSEIKEDISKKEHDLEDICEKEKLKNEERELQIAEQDKITQQRLETINNRQKEIDELNEQTKTKQSELEVIDFQLEDLDKTSIQQSQSNEGELKEFKQQQEAKRQNLSEINKLKTSKLQEIDEIDSRIQNADRELSELKSPAGKADEELSIAD